MNMKFQLLIILALCLATRATPVPSESAASGDEKPYGPYYCQARCLASCLETDLAPSLDECSKFCPPFDENTPCPSADVQCWRTCGVPAFNQPTPEQVQLSPSDASQNEELDPFLINVAWQAVENASIYIVEFYPRNRQTKPGENNFFRAMTTALSYSVRKEDECVEYDARVIAVNSYGISVPAHTLIQAPRPQIHFGDHFFINEIDKDPASGGQLVAVKVGYTFPYGWPVDDIAIDSIRLTATDCKGVLGARTFPAISGFNSEILVPSYNAIIEKDPFMQISILVDNDAVQADCLFQMRVASLTTRCNTSTTTDENPLLAPGVDFRINCDSFEGACNGTTTTVEPSPPAPIPLPPTMASPDSAMSIPGFLPSGIGQPQDTVNGTISSDYDIPTPPPVPLFEVDIQGTDSPPPQAVFSVIDIADNGTGVQITDVDSSSVVPPLCDMETVDVNPSLSQTSPSLIDLSVNWMERRFPWTDPLPPIQYFVLRYGPIVRNLVDDGTQKEDIMPGYEFETIVRTDPKLPGPTRTVNLPSQQRSSLLKLQICAIFDPNSEPGIRWEKIPGRQIDLAALEPFLDLDQTAQSASSAPAPGTVPVNIDTMGMNGLAPQVNSGTDDMVSDGTVIIHVGLEQKQPSNTFWFSVMAAAILILLTAMLVFIFLIRVCRSHRFAKKCNNKDKAIVVVSTPPQKPPTMVDMVKVPLA